jgi:hypothetical protein
MENINIEAILDKHLPYPLVDHTTMYVKAAIKEIVEAVIDKCAEDCIKQWCSDGESTGMWLDINDKESILKVKEMINY